MTLVDFLVFCGREGGLSLSASGAAGGGLLESDFRKDGSFLSISCGQILKGLLSPLTFLTSDFNFHTNLYSEYSELSELLSRSGCSFLITSGGSVCSILWKGLS